MFFFGLPLLILIWANIRIEIASDAYVTSDIEKLPNVKVWVIPGTKKVLAIGYINRYFQYIIDAAVRHYEARKVKHFLVSGNNGRKDYNEAKDMR